MHRLLQKRGQFVHAENFMVVRDTYPTHPLTTKEPNHKTNKELFEKRKVDKVKDYERQ